MPPSFRALPWASLLLAACAAAPLASPEPPAPPAPPAPGAPSAPGAPPAVSSVARVDSPPRPALPPTIPPAVGASCTLQGSKDTAEQALFLPGKSRPFGHLSGGPFELALPASGEPVVAARGPTVSLQAQTRFPSIALHPRRPLVLGGVVSPSGMATLQVRSVTAEGLTIRYEVGIPRVRVRPGTLEGAVRCEDVSLDASSFPQDGVVPSTQKATRMELRGGKAIPLRASEGGPVALELETPPVKPREKRKTRQLAVDDLMAPVIQVVKTSGPQSQVVFTWNQTTFFGWVPSASLQPAQQNLANLFGMGGLLGALGAPAQAGEEPDPQRICDQEVPLLVEHEGGRATLGAVQAGVCIDLREKSPDGIRIALRKSGLRTVKEARLLAPAWAVDACRRPRAEEAKQCEGDPSDAPELGLWGELLGSGEGLGGLGVGGLGAGGLGVGGTGGRKTPPPGGKTPPSGKK